MKKRLIALLLVLVTVLGMLPATALAAGSEEEALGEVNIYNGGQKLAYAVCAEQNKYGQLQNYMCDTDPAVTMRLSTYSNYGDDIDVELPDTGLKITKLEAGTDAPLSGAIFEVVGPDGATVGTFSTRSDGTVTIPLTLAGNYTVYERVAPLDHLLSDTPAQNIKVEYGKVAEVTFWNEPYGTLRVEKLSNTGAHLPGAMVQVKHIESGTVYSAETNFAGYAIFDNIKPGAYEIKEITAPSGWLKDDTTYTASVSTGETTTFALVNQELPGLRIIKYDRKNMVAMADVTFEVWRDGVSLGKFRTDEFGEILLTDVTPGTYRAVEVDTGSDGHILDTTPQEVELAAGDGIKELLFFNDVKPGLRLVKVDSTDPSRVIPNAVFEIKSVDGSYGPKEFTTDENGEIDLSKLPTGAYVVTEKACEGYIIDQAQRIIQLDPNEDAQFVFTNTIKPSLQIIKTNSDGSRLKNVTFRIAKIEDGTHYLDRTTNEQGEILIIDLEPGVYSIKETATDSSHILDVREYHMELFPGKTSTLTVENQKRPNLIVYKHDADTGEPIANTVFEVRAADGHSVDQIKTDSEGKAELKNLLPGVYEITEKSVPSPWLLDAPSQLATLYPNRDHTVYFENHKKPSLIVKKVDSVTGDALQGAKFQVTYASNNTVSGEINDLGTFYTDENGQFQLTGLRDGWYKVTELEPPTGYAIKEATQEVYIQSGTGKTLTFENIPLSALVVWKYDSVTGEAVSNAVFQVKYLTGTSGTGGTVIGTYKTSANGSFTVTSLREGTYIVEELASDSGHIIDTSPQTAYISGKEQDVVQLYFGNTPKGSLLIRKVCAVDPSMTLQNAEFKVTYSDGSVIGTSNGIYRSDENGEILIDGLEPGKSVVVTETRAPSGFTIDTQPQAISVLPGKTVSLTFKNQPKGTLIVTKVDASTGEPLSGAEFRITTAAGCEVGLDGVIGTATATQDGIFTTDAHGQIKLTNLLPGTYVLTEIKAPNGYTIEKAVTNVVIGSGGDTQSITIKNKKLGGLVINKVDSVTGKPLEGVQFKITYADGRFVDAEGGKLSSNGLYVTDQNGQIILNQIAGTIMVTEVQTIPGYSIDENTRTQTVVVNPDDTQTLTFTNTPVGGLIITKSDESSGKRLSGVQFEVRKMNGEIIGTYTTDRNGVIQLPQLDSGWYTVTELKTVSGYQLDTSPQQVEVKDGQTATLALTNRKTSNILLHKVDADTGKGIYGAVFLLYDSNHNPIGQYTTDQNGYIYMDEGLADGRYFIREIQAADGYILDTQLKTIYVQYGATSEITWENTAVRGQIQIIKKSADDNPINGLPAGTLLEGAVFEVYDKAGNKVDTIRTDRNGRAVSKLLPLSRYTVREVSAPAYYAVNPTVMTAYLEYEGQIVTFEVLDSSVATGVSITKTGPKEVMPGQPIRYTLKDIANTSTVPLSSFYWRDTLPGQMTLNSIVTGTYNQQLSYKVVYKTNLSGSSYRTLADNLSTSKNYVLDARPTILGLASNERIIEVMFVFGQVKAGFAQVETPSISGTVAKGLSNDSSLVNVADVGGLYNGQWIQAVSRTLTGVYAKTTVTLPKTGY